MSIFTTIEADFATSESWVLGLIAKIQQGIETVESDIRVANAWLFNHIGDINSALTEIETVAQSIAAANAGKLPATVVEAVKDANVAVAGLNAYVTSAAAGANTQQALVDGYVAAKNVAKATASAAVVIATSPVANPVITTTVSAS